MFLFFCQANAQTSKLENLYQWVLYIFFQILLIDRIKKFSYSDIWRKNLVQWFDHSTRNVSLVKVPLALKLKINLLSELYEN